MRKKKTKLIIRIVLLAATAVSLFFVPWPIVKAWIKPLPKSVQAQVDKAAGYGFDGIIVYVDQKGKPPAYYTSGYKNRDTKTPADPHSLFKIASVSKLYTAVSVAKLAYAGRLSLDSTLADYMPELKGKIEYANKITIRMMVQHRSGIPDYMYTKDYWVHPKETSEEKLALIINAPANFEPDKKYQYSNTNYLLLRSILDKQLGYPHFQYIKEQVLDPLGLQHTFGSIHDVNINDVMSGYYVGYDSDLKTDDVGSMLATADDVARFIRALNEGTAFTDKKEQEIYTSIYKYGHTGLIPGYQTIAKFHKDIDAVVVQFTNTVNFDGYNWNMSEIMYNRIVKIVRRSL